MHPRPSSDDNSLNSIWTHVLIGPVVWAIHFLVGYGLTEVVCVSQWANAQWYGLSILAIVILALTLVAFLITLYAAWVSYRTWKLIRQRIQDAPEVSAAVPTRSNAVESPRRAEQGASQFMALSGALLSGLFALTILITGLPALVLNPCG